MSNRYTGRRLILWPKLTQPVTAVATGIATAGGAGLLPLAPGTYGSLVGSFLCVLLSGQGTDFRLGFWVILFVLGVWASRVFDQAMGTQDNQNIVIDEVVGVGIASWWVQCGALHYALTFVLFRVFDILKPFPVGLVDRWSHSQKSPFWDGVGVMIDDVLAGFQALFVYYCLQKFHLLPSDL